MAHPITDYVLTAHAAYEMSRRGISERTLKMVLVAPEQRESVRIGRDVLQSRIDFGGELYLVRVFVDVDRTPAEVVAVYRTSNIARYWRSSS